jgi:hypothetical protein
MPAPIKYLDPNTVSKFADFFLQRGSRPTGIFLTIGALAKIAAGVVHRNLDEVLTGVLWFGGAGAYLSLFFTTKRGNDMTATGFGEIKQEFPDLKNSSQDPAIARVIAKIDLGIPHTGTSAATEKP